MKEERLIQYIFNLCSDSERREIEQALASSPGDRAQLDRLKARFAQLDLIKEDVTASETLIADTLRKVRLAEPARKSRTSFFLIYGPVAALLLVGLFLPKLLSPSAPTGAPRSASIVRNGDFAFEKKSEQSLAQLDKLAPLPQRSDGADFDIPAEAPPAAESAADQLTMTDGKEMAVQTPGSVAFSPMLAKADARDAVAAENGAFRAALAPRYIAADTVRSKVSAYTSTRGRTLVAGGLAAAKPYGADELFVVDLADPLPSGDWSAGPSNCVAFHAEQKDHVANVSASHHGDRYGITIRWQHRPLAFLQPGSETNFTINIEDEK